MKDNSKLKNARIEHKFSIADESKLLGVSESYIYQIERGTKIPSFKIMKKISEVLNTPVQDLFFND